MLKSLVLTRFSGMFFRKPKEGKKPKNMAPLYILLFLYIAFAFGSMFVLNYSTIYESFVVGMGNKSIYFAMAAFVSMLLSFIGSIMMTQSQLYQAKDNELLLSMPIKPSMILASRIIALYISAFAFSALNYIPAMIVAISNGSGVASIVVMVIELITIPLLSMTISFIFAWLLELITSHMNNKALFSIIGSLLFLAVYLVFCMRMYSIATIVTENADSVVEAFKTYLYPFYVCGMAAGEPSFANVLLLLIITLVPFAIAYAILSKTFISIATTKAGYAKTKYVAGHMKASGVRKAVAFKEIKHFISSSAYAVNGGVGLFMMLAGAIYIAIKSQELFDMVDAIEGIIVPHDYLVSVFIIIVASIGTIAEVTVCSISLEGNNLWILKSAPIKAHDILEGKLYAHMIIALPFTLGSGIALNFMPYMNWIERIVALLLPTVFQLFVAYFGLAVNLRFPRLDWTNETQAIKQSAAAFIAVFGGMGLVLVLVLLFVFGYSFLRGDILLIISILLPILGSLCYEFYLRGKGSKRFEEL